MPDLRTTASGFKFRQCPNFIGRDEPLARPRPRSGRNEQESRAPREPSFRRLRRRGQRSALSLPSNFPIGRDKAGIEMSVKSVHGLKTRRLAAFSSPVR
jgi:hypothetical protein